MTVTTGDLLAEVLAIIGAAEGDEVASAAEERAFSRAVNLFLNHLSARSSMIHAAVMESFTLTAAQRTYTVKTSGEFNTPTPVEILDGCYVRDSNNADTPIRVISLQEYNAYGDKLTATGRPEAINFDPGQAQQSTRQALVSVYPIPDSSTTWTLFLALQKPLTEIVSHWTSLTFHPAYFEFLAYAMAVRLYHRYHDHRLAIPAEILDVARETEAAVVRMNRNVSDYTASANPMPSLSGGSRFNVYSGE